jgi:hypothetical protein
MGWEIIAATVLQNVLKEGRVLSTKNIELFELLRDLLVDILSGNPRHCFDNAHTCEYRDHACHVSFTKGRRWTSADIENCPYRKKAE